jgi:hypothetical protein
LGYRAFGGLLAEHLAPNIMQAQSALSYVTGATPQGGSGLPWRDAHEPEYGQRPRPPSTGSTTAVPNQLTEFSQPFVRAWTLRETGSTSRTNGRSARFTANAGLRFDHYTTTFPATHLGPASLVPNRNISFPEGQFLQLQRSVPRALRVHTISLGNGRTALKVTVNRYLNGIRADRRTPGHQPGVRR